MLEPGGVLVGIAVAVVLTTVVFLVVVAVAAVRRWRGGMVGRTYGRLVAFLGGLAIGTFFLVNAGVASSLVFMLVVAGVVVSSVRRGRRTDAGWHLVGVALPWTILWTIYVWAMLTGLNRFDAVETWRGLGAGAVAVAIGLAVAATGDRTPRPPRQDSGRWQPGSRTIGTLATAIRGSNSIGPFGVQEVAAVATLVAVQVVLGALLALAGLAGAVTVATLAIAGAVAATEAYIRAMPRPSRLAFEAFSWLGEQEIARLRAETGEGVPLGADAAERWLARHPDRPDLRWARAEVLLVAGRFEEARDAAEGMPSDTPVDRVNRAATLALADWMAGGAGDVTQLEAAVQEVPPESEDGLRAAVSLAAARTRNRMSDGRTEPGDAALPLIEVRPRLGPRADGQVGRALRKRLIPVFLVAALAFSLVEVLLDGAGALSFGV